MPIKSLKDPTQNKAEYSVGRDVELSYCSDTCLLKAIDDRSRIVRTGQTPATALTVILSEDRLLVPVAGAPRPPAHVLGEQHSQASARSRWDRLVGCSHPALMPVYRVCDCMAETRILDGQEFEDATTTPAWKKVRGIVGRVANTTPAHAPVGFDQWRHWMADLADGLAELERQGLAHGDPYPFNAVHTGRNATWVDFGHMTDDPAQRYKDAWAFVLFTVLHTQEKCTEYSSALLRDLAAEMATVDQSGAFERIASVLRKPRGDQLETGDVRTPALLFVEAVTEQPHSPFHNPVAPQLLLKASIQYFSAFLHHIQRGNQYSSAFHSELQRHRFQEEEMLRLTVPRTEHQSQLQAQQVSHTQAIEQKDAQLHRQQQAIAELNTTVDHKNEHAFVLDRTIAELSQRIALQDQAIAQNTEQASNLTHLQQILAQRDQQVGQMRSELDSLFKRHEQILSSRSWRLTRPLRAAARFAKYGFNYPGGRQALYRTAANIGRKFPFPLWLKARVRAALMPKYPALVAPVRAAESSSVPTGPAFNDKGSPQRHATMRPEHCGLIEGLVSVILPVYNQASLIAESIDSVLAQTYQNFELIIINDGSKDGVEGVLQRYLDHPKVRCYTQANQRLPKALSNGFDFARGEFWTWTSADNIMEPRMLEELVAKLRSDQSIGLVYADYYAIDDRGALLKDATWRAHNRPDPASGAIRLPHSTQTLNTVQDNFIGPCFMYRGWVGQCMGDYDTQLGIEDYDYWMRINAFFPVRHVGSDSLLYRYRVHDNTLSAQAHEHKILDKVQLLMEYEKGRAKFYQSAIDWVADNTGAEWLMAQGVSPSDITAFTGHSLDGALTVLGAGTAEQHVAALRNDRQPVAIILGQADTRYHKLRQLLREDHCIALAADRISAERVRLVSRCPLIDLHSASTLQAVRAFAKNLLFTRATRKPEDMQRTAPEVIRSAKTRHVLLQVDSFTQGGMENVVIDLALSLQACGYRVTIGNLGKAGDAAAKATERGLRVASLASEGEDNYLSWLKDNSVDLVNAHYSVHGAAACRRAGIPFVQTIHNSYVWLDPEQMARYRGADPHTTQYLCVSVTAARYAEVTLGLDIGKMRVVPNGIDPETILADQFAENRAALRATWGVDANTPVFVNVASIMATKAQLPLVKSFAQVVDKYPDARLVLLGTSMEASYHSAVKNAVKELRLQKNVIFAGYERQVARYYHAADVFVLPSYWEGWSLSLGEAMANGLSCVITDVGSAYEFEGRENVEVVSPPFGDLTTLNYQNLGQFVYGDDAGFQERLAHAMLRSAAHLRGAVNRALAESLDRSIAYRMYAEFFSTL
ncbi:MAG: glycosyltransferase [Burkholderiaceae bacterium]|jgi:glycosyltransferase involved in cell wall biosynthesis|nr:glycosyltransferase [Burkholderiaceae bacterium]